MNIIVGSINPVKIRAVREAFEHFEFEDIKVFGVEVSSEVSEQPKGFDEIFLGAKNRAENSFVDCTYSVGIEGGLFKTPEGKWMNVTVCAIYDGENYFTGLSPGFNLPHKVQEFIEHNKDLNEASFLAGITTEERLGYGQGTVGIITKGKVHRKDYSKQAVFMALGNLNMP